MSVVSEEDVMDVLLTWFLVFCVVNPRGANADGHPETWATEIPMIPWDVAMERLGDGGLAETEAAIADSERRLEVERARDEIVRAVEIGISKMPLAVERARTRYVLALTAALEGK